MKKTVLREYARLIARVGLNVQKGQDVLVYAGLDQPEFVKMVVEECYRAKAREVTVQWLYDPLEKIHNRYQSVKTMADVPEWVKARQEHWCQTLPCRLFIESSDPDGMKGMNMEKAAKARKISYPILKPYSDRRDGLQQWCIAAVPGAAWARKVFPGLRTGAAVEKLWEAILSAARVTEDSVKSWEDHNANLRARCDYLNSLGIEKLHYTADNGTDLTVGMIPEAVFCGGSETSRQNITFNPNIPSEECFISPRRGQAEGIVYSTKPLSYNGQLIDGFFMRFEDGHVVESGARVGEENLHTMLSMDEGASYLGECALVPQHSPICESGILYYNTLFDENAACHLAVGRGFNDTIRDYHSKTNEQCKALGINDSMIHVDFMIGCDSMNIDAICADGKIVPIFRNGNWAF